MKKMIALVLAAVMLCAAPLALAAEDEKLEPLFATVGDALAAAGENPVAGGEEEYYAVVTEKDGKYYRSVAEMDEKAKALQQATLEADIDHMEAAFAAADEYIRTLPITYSEVFTAEPMGQAEMDALVGETLGALREMGYEDREWGTDVDENEEMIIAYVMQNGLFDYRCVVDVDYDTYEKAQEWELSDSDFVVKSVALRGITGEACFQRFHLDGTVEEPEDPFAMYTELVGLVLEMLERIQNGEEVNVEEFFGGLKEQFPDLVETIDMYLELFRLFGADQLAGMLTPAE